ncbi:hypothetical protein P12x_003054 [Tundrisphaera lichenicola]|uniref:hypothetical protein n=1 Tax=Tundrisphaera lichenicola TaxID=2029860 RepID=UPI003EBA1DAC
MAVVIYPLMTVTDDSGNVVVGATVAIASVKDLDGADVASHGAVIHQSGANVSVAFDAEAKGEPWITLAISKAGSVFTGLNASPSFFLAKDSGRLLTALPVNAPAGAGGLPTVGTGAGQISLAAGAVTAGTVTDKSGYSLAPNQSFNLTGNITGNLSGNVGGYVTSLATNAITNQSFADGAIASRVFAADTKGDGVARAGSGSGNINLDPNDARAAGLASGPVNLYLEIVDGKGINQTRPVASISGTGADMVAQLEVGYTWDITPDDTSRYAWGQPYPAGSAELLRVASSVWDPATVATRTLSGFNFAVELAANGMGQLDTTPAAAGEDPTFQQMMVAIWRRWYTKFVAEAGVLTGYADDGTTPLTTQPLTDDGTTQTQGAA